MDACGVGLVADKHGTPAHSIIAMALEALARLAHRGAAATDNSADGAGLLTQIPRDLLTRDVAKLAGIDAFAVGMFFLPADAAGRERARAIVESVLAADRIPFIAWRDVPTNPAVLGETARQAMPSIRQLIVGRPAGIPDDDAWERALYLTRREMEHRAAAEKVAPFYACSFSCRTIVYKGLVAGGHLAEFFTDLADPAYTSAIAIFHERYATNTLPRWDLAQPFRALAHNGEINTLWGNRNGMAMRADMLTTPIFGDRTERIRDVIVEGGSDSASLDNAFELLVRAGRSPAHTAMMLVPQAWEKLPGLDPAIRGFYEYHQCILEPWDGPAALAWSDGVVAGMSLDRNGLRPCRYAIRADGLVVAGSEVGIVDLDPAQIVETGKVAPGGALLVDTVNKRVVANMAMKVEVSKRRPYDKWVGRYMRTLTASAGVDAELLPPASLRAFQMAFGIGFEDVRYMMEPMGEHGVEPAWSMGDDTPIAPLALHPRSVYAYLRQRFAQVTNPPIDSLRETMVMSLRMHLGRRSSPLLERPDSAHMMRIEHPVLLADEMERLRDFPGFRAVTIDATWPAHAGASGLMAELPVLCRAAERAVKKGARILIISDRAAGKLRVPIPALLALGAVRQHLVRTGQRAKVGIVVESGDAFDPHHFATLFGYGAEAVHPWLACATVAATFAEAPGHGRNEEERKRPEPHVALVNYRTAVEKGLLKILGKMGISTLSSYCGAQIFEALGLGAEIIDRCFAGTVSLLGGVSFQELGEDALARHSAGFAKHDDAASHALPDYGRIRYRRDGEDHGWAPQTVVAMQKAVGAGKAAKTGGAPDADAWRAFVESAQTHRPAGPRDLLRVKRGTPIPIEEVESAESIRRRFVASAMSLGSLSPEAHSTITLAMNRMGARSNSGEGGEDANFYVVSDGDRRDSRIKQVASGRFGVTTEYLTRAEEIEIKIVQGAKPGEGGQLPGFKVTELIARLRHSVPGVSLISPPPHHDIYSIEDLAQLVHDLKSVNPRTRVGVKLVAEAGVGTVAAGVAKAWADYVLIAGHNGGTGASPLSSIKHVGSPWELGLAETQQVLVRNALRHRVELRVDGGFKTARDVIIAALLGAESYGFGTAAMVAVGCAMARQCHSNTCPAGVATQREDLRAKFTGTPEQVIAYFTFIAEDVRTELAALGARTMDEIIGRADLLERWHRKDVPRSNMLDLSMLLVRAERDGEATRSTVRRNERKMAPQLDAQILEELAPSLTTGGAFHGAYTVRNHHLAVGARVAGQIAERRAAAGLPVNGMAPGTVALSFTGTAGQSFGAFSLRGMQLTLQGAANDYVGKGLCGGELIIKPVDGLRSPESGDAHGLIGNTALYGATSGRLFVAGQAGDRFGVRNSGVVAVVEGAGNHCCEYMTGGVVVVLGRAGRNFGAGMSNGVAYVLDESGTFAGRVNHEMVLLAELDGEDELLVKKLLEAHVARTGSARAQRYVKNWATTLPRLRKVEPRGAAEHVRRIRQRVLAPDYFAL